MGTLLDAHGPIAEKLQILEHIAAAKKPREGRKFCDVLKGVTKNVRDLLQALAKFQQQHADILDEQIHLEVKRDVTHILDHMRSLGIWKTATDLRENLVSFLRKKMGELPEQFFTIKDMADEDPSIAQPCRIESALEELQEHLLESGFLIDARPLNPHAKRVEIGYRFIRFMPQKNTPSTVSTGVS